MLSSRTQSWIWRFIGSVLILGFVGLTIWVAVDDTPAEMSSISSLILICGLLSWGLADVFLKLAQIEERTKSPTSTP